jgi:anti-sigma regulatory factor (Ser/Thr protein kinase)
VEKVTMVEYRARLPVGVRAPASARRLVRCLEGDVGDEDLENLELLVTELVTNAVRHAGLGEGGWVSVELVAGTSFIHVEVCDPGRGFDPQSVSAAPGQPRGSGWGLFLVAQLSTRWGVRHDDCTRVWFDLATSGASASVFA